MQDEGEGLPETKWAFQRVYVTQRCRNAIRVENDGHIPQADGEGIPFEIAA